MIIPAGTVKRVHISQPAIRENLKNGTDNPVVTVKKGNGENLYAHEVIVRGEMRLVTTGRLSCGARVWLETRDEVELISR